jgi:hypothetical protein
MELTNQDIKNLIDIGLSDTSSNKTLFSCFISRDFINRLHWKTWRQFANELNDNELIHLFKGLVKTENEFKWMGGSVAGAIWVYRIIEERNLDRDFKIADFGFANCENPYVPFGNSYYGRRTSKDYFGYRNQKARESILKAEKYSKVLRRVEGRKEKRKQAIAELRKLTNEERGEILENLKHRYSSHSILEKLTLMANDDVYPPEYYPSEWIEISSEEIKTLPIDLIKKLYDKLSTKTMGQWKRFALELRKLDDGI